MTLQRLQAEQRKLNKVKKYYTINQHRNFNLPKKKKKKN